MPLPSAVQAISDRAEKMAIESGMQTQPTEPAAAPATPEAVTPAPAPEKVEQDDWKERYSRYRTATDQTIADLRQTAANSDNTIAQLKAQLDELANKVNAAPVVETGSYEQWLEKVPARLKDEYTEEYLRDQYELSKLNTPVVDTQHIKELETKLDGVLKTQEVSAATRYEQAMDAAFPDDKWITMTNGEDWNKFCSQRVSPIDRRLWGDVVKQASAGHDSDTVTWVLRQFQSTLDTKPPVVEENPLLGQLTPEGGAGSDPASEADAAAPTFTSSQVTKFYEDVTKRKYTPEQAKDIEQQILAAQKAGKITQG